MVTGNHTIDGVAYRFPRQAHCSKGLFKIPLNNSVLAKRSY